MPESTIESAYLPKGVIKLANTVMKFLLRSPMHGATSDFMLLLSFKGRKSGKTFVTPVSYHVQDGNLCVFTPAPWISNLRDVLSVDIVLKGANRKARPEIIDDPTAVSESMYRALKDFGPANASRFAMKITGGEVPPADKIREALGGRKMLRLHLDG